MQGRAMRGPAASSILNLKFFLLFPNSVSSSGADPNAMKVPS